MCEKPTDDSARDDLETALVEIMGLAKIMQAMGQKDEAAAYLGTHLMQHFEAADDAFNRIFGLEHTPRNRARET